MKRTETDWTELDDAALVRAVQGGEPRAFEPLVDRHLEHVHAFVALRLPVAHLVDEITHEAFVAAFRMMGRFTAGTNLHGWLRTIAANLVRKELGRYHREQENKLGYAQRREIDLALTEEDELTSREAEALRECLEKVPPLMRSLLDLKYRDGCKSEEIGARLQRSMAWVRTTLFRVREQLRACIEGKLEGGRHAGA
jgi:RNA polymerase sigma-70 factor (ECF subfamily)